MRYWHKFSGIPGEMASRRKSSWADDLVLAPWWISFALAVFAFALLPAVLPPALRGLVLPITFVLLCLSAISILRSWKNQWMLDRQTGLSSIRELSSKQFENLLGEAYRRQGYKVEETLGGGADGGVDLVLRRDGATILVQCKRWLNKPVRVQTVRELYGVMHDQHATAGKLITTSNFTSEAIAFAKGKPIEMIGAKELVTLIRSVQERNSGKLTASPTDGGLPPVTAAATTDRRPTVEDGGEDHRSTVDCPRCGAEMVKRTARRGPNPGSEFWGCSNFPKTGCRGRRDLSNI